MNPPLQLCLDIGNTDIHGGVFEGSALRFEFRKSNRERPSVDEFGVFLVQLLRTHGIEPEAITEVAAACVVPDSLRAVVGASEQYLRRPVLVLETGVRTGLKIKVKDPREVGADRIANAIAAVDLFPERNLILIDMGTATTFCAVTARREYLGGAIAAGLGLSMRALGTQTAKLPLVDVVKPASALGRTTVENIQAGLYYGHVGLVREMVARLREEAFGGEPALVVGTGGLSRLFDAAGLFDEIVPALVLRGLQRALALNRTARPPSPGA
jgi:type III pantothenate kinase